MTEKRIQKKFVKIIRKYTDVKKSEIHAGTNLKIDLGISSFDYVSIIGDIEQVFGIAMDNLDEFTKIQTVLDISKIICKKLLESKGQNGA